jgi:membrane protein
MKAVEGLVDRADAAQRRRGALGFPLAVLKKFGEDKAGQLAALIAYYGFFSLFPLLLVFVTLAGLVVQERETQDRLVDAALAQFPGIGDQLKGNVRALPGKGIALAVGVAASLWAGLAGVKAAQNAMDHVWDVPVRRQPNFVKAILRALLMLASLGVFVVLTTFLGGVAAGAEDAPAYLRLLGIVGSLLANVAIFLVGYRVLTVEDVSWRDVLPGAVIGGVAWTVLQAVGGYLMGYRLESARETYQLFAVVIGLLTWIYLGAQVLLLGAEVNVVRARRLWPRALDPDDRTEADERVLRDHARVEERREEETVQVRFGDEPGGAGGSSPSVTGGPGSAGAGGAVPPATGGPEPVGPLPPTVTTTDGARGTATLLRSIANDLSTLVTKQIELAKQEVREMVASRARAMAFLAVSAVLGLFIVGFLGMAGAEALALVLPRWAAMLIVAGVFVLIAVIAVLVARAQLRAGASKPELTQESLKEDVEWAKQQLRR